MNRSEHSETTAAGPSEITMATGSEMDGPLVTLTESDFIPDSLDQLVTLLGLEADGPVCRLSDLCTTFATDDLWPI